MVAAEHVMLSGDVFFFCVHMHVQLMTIQNVPQGIVTCCALRKENVPAKDRYQEDDDIRKQTLMTSLLKALYDTCSLLSYQIFKINYLFIKNIQRRLMFPLYNSKDITTKLSRAPVSCNYQIPLFSLMF